MPVPFFIALPPMPVVVPLFYFALFFTLFGSDGLVPLLPAWGELVIPGSDGFCCAV